MPRRPLPSPETCWNLFLQRYLELFTASLNQLAGRESVTGDENAISERLCLILRTACFEFNQRNKKAELRAPVWEAPIQPAAGDEINGGKRRKRPDFTCSCYNHDANSPEQMEISLHVECKRLGFPTRPSWNLNKNYVKNGVQRFDCVLFNYGKRAPAGMMIGYITGMEPEDIRADVNACQKQQRPNYPEIIFDSNEKSVLKARQMIHREAVEPLEFELIHLWADLRAIYRS